MDYHEDFLLRLVDSRIENSGVVSHVVNTES